MMKKGMMEATMTAATNKTRNYRDNQIIVKKDLMIGQ